MDRLLVEDVGPEQLLQEPVIGIVGDLAAHWADSTRLFLKVQHRWLAELEERGELDAAARRNRLFDYAAARWAETTGDPDRRCRRDQRRARAGAVVAGGGADTARGGDSAGLRSFAG